MRQNITPFVLECLAKGWKVQIETNGTLYLATLPYYHEHLFVVCSPKTPKPHSGLPGKPLYYKYLLRSDLVDSDGLPSALFPGGPRPARPGHALNVFVQPLDEGDERKNAENTKAALESCLRHGWTLSLQLHKQLDLP